MKKLLTVSLLAMMAVGTARADIASTDYADKVAAAAQSAAEETAARDATAKSNTARQAAEETAATNLSTTIANYSTTEQMNAAIKVETDRATAAEAALGTRIDNISAGELTIKQDAVTAKEIKDGEVKTAEIADDAVTTAKIADKNVTKVKLSEEVQASLDKADAAAPQSTTYSKTEVDAKISNVAVADAAAQKVTAPSIEYAQSMINTSLTDTSAEIGQLKQKVGDTAVSTQISTAVNALANGAVATNTGNIGTLSSLTTTDKSNLVAAINEVEGTAEAAMNFDDLKTDASWTTAKCGETDAVCSLVSKNGSIAWERVQP